MSAKPPFDPSRWAMALLATVIVAPMVVGIEVSVRCVWFWIEACKTNWAGQLLTWTETTIPVLIALIMWRGNNRPPPPPPPVPPKE
ncbi:MAG TPA: hypothetical protein VGI78_09475 [Acetobacteraceae bacterium]|jgi:hypothetical protein